jgi:ubiquinone/menaquinone biosynthesis C-methylase UbiE
MHGCIGIRGLLALAAALLACSCRTAPQPPEQSVRPGVNDPYRRADVGAWVERFERQGREIYDRRREIVAACRIGPGWAVADVGAGTGLFVDLLAGAVGPQGTVYAVDIVPEFIEHIEARALDAGLENVRTILCTERSVELPPGSIDMAFVCDAYHHFEYPRSMMSSIHRALRPGGILVIVEFQRVEGVSSDFVMGHVRAGREQVIAEIESFGFTMYRPVLESLLRDNYMVCFGRR